MKTKHIIIGLTILIIILFIVQKKEHAGSTPPATPNLSNEAIQNIAKIYADTNNEAVFNNLKATGNATINGTATLKGATTVDGAITLKGATTVDGPATLKGASIVDGVATFNQNTNFKGGNNPNNWGTHFPFTDGNNYIRGTTNVDGDLYYTQLKAKGGEKRPGVHGGGGGGPFDLICPYGTVMVGLTGRAGRVIDQIGPICR